MSAKLEAIRARVAVALAELEPLFPGYRLTFVARYEDSAADADVIVSPEPDLGPLIALLQEHAYREAPYVCPGCHTVGGGPCAPGCVDAEMEEREELRRSTMWHDDAEDDYDPAEDDF